MKKSPYETDISYGNSYDILGKKNNTVCVMKKRVYHTINAFFVLFELYREQSFYIISP